MGDNDSLLNGALSFLLALSVSLSITLSAFKEVEAEPVPTLTPEELELARQQAEQIKQAIESFEAVAVPIVAIVGLVSLCVVVAWRLYGKGRY